MNTTDRFLLFSPTSIRLPRELYHLIERDAWLFGFRKNNKSNLNGFLNELLPALAFYQERASTLLSTVAELEETTYKEIISGILKFDSLQLSLLKDKGITLSFRVNKTHANDFIEIYDNHLRDYNMDFSAFVRSSLLDYVTKRLFIRERLLHYKNFDEISSAIPNNQVCLFLLKNATVRFAPVRLFISPNSDLNILVGFSEDQKPQAIPFCEIVSVIRQDAHVHINSSNLSALENHLGRFLAFEGRTP